MCGIVGMSFRRDVSCRKSGMKDIRKIFTNMLVRAQARGSSATGIVLMSRESRDSKPKAVVLRSPLSASVLVKTKEYEDLIAQLNEHALSIIGHTRAVTGNAPATNNYNNHPHTAGPIIGVHNGMISNDHKLWAKNSGYMIPKGHCDSEVIFALINRKLDLFKHTETAIAKAVEELEGWFALALVNAKSPEKLYLLRDQNTPLEFGWWGYAEVAAFASQYSYIEESFKEVRTHITLDRHRIDPMTLITLDGSFKAASHTEVFVGTKQIRSMSDIRRAEIIADNKEAFETSQGN